MRYLRPRITLSALVTGLALAIAAPQLCAQDAPSASATSVIDDRKIDQMAAAYIAIDEIKTQANQELESAADPAGAHQVIDKAEHAIIQAVERTGLKLQEFNRLSELAALDPTLSARIEVRIRERQPI